VYQPTSPHVFELTNRVCCDAGCYLEPPRGKGAQDPITRIRSTRKWLISRETGRLGPMRGIFCQLFGSVVPNVLPHDHSRATHGPGGTYENTAEHHGTPHHGILAGWLGGRVGQRACRLVAAGWCQGLAWTETLGMVAGRQGYE
jgi:hypothetical protein